MIEGVPVVLVLKEIGILLLMAVVLYYHQYQGNLNIDWNKGIYYDKISDRKEFKQLLRNSFLPRLILIFPCMIMLLMPWAVNLEIKNIQLNIVDNDHSVISQRLVNKIAASTYFRLTEVPASYEDGLRNIEQGTADIIMEIPRHLERLGEQRRSPYTDCSQFGKWNERRARQFLSGHYYQELCSRVTCRIS